MIRYEDLGRLMWQEKVLALDGNELKMLLNIATRLNVAHYCDTSNKRFVEELKVSERGIANWVSSLAEKGVVTVKQDPHNHKRRIYINGLDRIRYKTEPTWEEMSEAQRKFKTRFPNRRVDCDVPPDVDMDELLKMIEKSKWVKSAENMGLYSCCVKHYKTIMAGWNDVEDMPRKSNFSCGRDYSREEMNALFQKIEDIEI